MIYDENMRKIATAMTCMALLFTAGGPAIADVIAPSGRVIECFCTDTYGKRRELGEIICLTVGGRSFMAKCVMAQNNPFWRDQKMGCLSSRNMSPADPEVRMSLRAMSEPISPEPELFAGLQSR